MIPLQAFQGVAVSAFLKQSHRPVAAFIEPAAAVVVVGAVGALAAYVVGPLLFRLIYPPATGAESAYEVAASGITLGAGLRLGTAGAHDPLGQYGACGEPAPHLPCRLGGCRGDLELGVLVPAPLVPRAIVALAVGPVCGFVVHMVGVSLASRRKPRR